VIELTTRTIISGQIILTIGHVVGDFSLRKVNVTLNCLCRQAIEMLVNSMWANPNVRPLGMVLGSVRKS